MNKELKKVIVNWLLENENKWQRVNTCKEKFRNYIYDEVGNYIIGGEIVGDFINNADRLLYSEKYLK